MNNPLIGTMGSPVSGACDWNTRHKHTEQIPRGRIVYHCDVEKERRLLTENVGMCEHAVSRAGAFGTTRKRFYSNVNGTGDGAPASATMTTPIRRWKGLMPHVQMGVVAKAATPSATTAASKDSRKRSAGALAAAATGGGFELRAASQNEHEKRIFDEYRRQTGEMMHSFSFRVNVEAKKKFLDTLDWKRPGMDLRDEYFQPETLDELVGTDFTRQSVASLDKWLDEWDAFYAGTRPTLPDQCMVLIKGPSGCGKRIATRLALQKHNYRPMAFDVSVIRGPKLLRDHVMPVLLSAQHRIGAHPQRTALVLDQFDAAQGSGSGGGMAAATPVGEGGGPPGSSEKGGLVPFLLGQGLRRHVVHDNPQRKAWKYTGFMSPCPIILIANDYQYPSFLKKVQTTALFLPFYHANFYVIADSLYAPWAERLKIKWTYSRTGRLSLAQRMANMACGDVRKAAAMMVAAIRCAYADGSVMEETGELKICQRHCAAFLVPQISAPRTIFQLCTYLVRGCPDAAHAMNAVVRHRVPSVPDTLYENYPLLCPRPASVASPPDVAAYLDLTADLAAVFSHAERYRFLFDYVRNDVTQALFHMATTLGTCFLVCAPDPMRARYEQLHPRPVAPPAPKRARKTILPAAPAGEDDERDEDAWLTAQRVASAEPIEASSSAADTPAAIITVETGRLHAPAKTSMRLEKASNDGNHGIRAQWQQMIVQERNKYTRSAMPRLRVKTQASVTMFLSYSNYCTTMEHTRRQGSMISHLKENATIEAWTASASSAGGKK